MEKYNEYKDSGVQWLGEIPSHWDIYRIRYNYFLKGRIGWQGLKADEFQDAGPFLVTGTDFQNGKVNWDTCYHISQERYEEAPEIHVQQHDLLMTKDGTVGKTAYIDSKPEKVSLNSHLLIIRPFDKEKCNNRFLQYLIESDIFKNFTNIYSTGSIMASISQEKFCDFRFPLPPIIVQAKIINFLDNATAKIDEAIAQQQKMIDLLNERKQIIINNAVTKGLNPDAPMKDSGVDWIGEIPEHWEVTMLKKKSKIILGKMLSNAPGSQYEYFCAKDVHYNSADDTDLKQMNFTDSERQQYQVIKGDMLIVEGGAGAGGCAIYKGNKTAYIQNSIMIVRGNEDMINEYICYFMQSINKRGYIEFICNKATIPHFTKEKVGAVNIAVPPIEEQKAIIEYINKSCTPIDGAISTASKQISLLQERKQIIINDVVTGKVRVC